MRDVKSEMDAVRPLYDIHNELAAYFQLQLTLDAQAADYVVDRRLLSPIVDRFGIGYCPDGQAVYNFAMSRGWAEDALEAIGFWSLTDNSVYVKFEGRLMFPIRGFGGQVHGFSGRLLAGESDAKYINTNNCATYNKSLMVYGLYEALEANPEIDRWVLVEGNIDVVAMHQAGFTTTVACSGTAVTVEQLMLLRQFSDRIYIVMDNDTAGKQSSTRVVKLLNDLHFNWKICTLQGVKDVDEALRTNQYELIQQLLR